MAQTEVVIDGDLYVDNYFDAEFGVYIRAGEESPLDEIYGTWTDIVGKYLGRGVDGSANFTPLKTLDGQGEVVDGALSVCPNYIPVSPSYDYSKNGYRLLNLCCYDENKNFISKDSSARYDNQTWVQLQIPENARYIRFCATMSTANLQLQIIRTR